MKIRLVGVLITLLLLTQLTPLASLIASGAKPPDGGGIPVRVGAPVDVKYVGEPVVFSVFFSYGEVASGSIRILDEEGVETPYQILEERYYEGTSYYSYVKILMLTDVEKPVNRSYTLTYSRTPMRKPDYSALCDLKASETIVDKTRLLVVKNSYIKAVFGLNPSKGLQEFYYLESGLNKSIISPLWSLASPSVMVNGRWLGPPDMEDMSVAVTVNGSLMVEVTVSGRLPGFKVEEVFRFYTHSRFFDFETTLTPVGENVDALSVFSAFYRKGVFENVLLSNGSSVALSSIPGVRSFEPGNWSMLVGPYGNIYVTITPEARLSRLAVETDIPDYDLVMYLVDASEISGSTPLVFKGRLLVLPQVPSLDVLNGEYFKCKKPLVAEVSLPKVLFNVKGPKKVDIYETFKLYLQVLTRSTLRRVLLNASTSSPNLVCLSKPVYTSFVPRGVIWTTAWYFRASAEGSYTINFSLSTWNETLSVLYNIKVVIPALGPSVDVVFRVVDFDNETAIGDVDVVLLDNYGDVAKTLTIGPSGNTTASVQIGSYKALIYRNGSLVGCNEVGISRSENVTLKTWAYDFDVLTVNEEGQPIGDALVLLRSLNQNISAEYRRFSNASGVARFEDVFNGTYELKVFWRGELVENRTVNIQRDELTHKTVFENWGMKVEVSVPEDLPPGVRYVGEPVVFSVFFSYGEVASGSIRILDEEGVETPYQILEERYYKGTKYYRYAKLLILTDVEKPVNRSYIVKYSSKPSEAPPYNESSDLRVWRTPVRNGTWDIIVENSYLRAVFKGNSSIGLYRLYYLESGLNESLVSPFWSFASPCVMVDGRWFTPLDMRKFNISVTVNGSLMVEVTVNGSLPGFEVIRKFRFYPHSRFFEFVTTFIPVENVNVELLSPFNTIYPRTLFYRLLLSDGSSIDLTSLPGGRSFEPGNWSMLVGPYGNIYVTVKPETKLDRLILETGVPGYYILTYLAEFEKSSSPLVFEGRVVLFDKVPSLETLNCVYLAHKTPPAVKVKTPIALLKAIGPDYVKLGEPFYITIYATALRDLEHVCMNASVDRRALACLSTPVCRDRLCSGCTWEMTWVFRGLTEGSHKIWFTVSTLNDSVSIGYTVNVVLPSLRPSVNVTFMVADFDGETLFKDVDLGIVNPVGDVVNASIGSSGNVTVKLQMGTYDVFIYKDRRLIGRETVEVFQPANITLRTWTYDFNVKVFSKDGMPMVGIPALLKALGVNVTGEYMRLSTSNGLIRFDDVPNGTYNLKVLGWQRELIKEVNITVQEDELTYVVKASAWFVGVKALTADGEPLPDVVIHLLDANRTELKVVKTDANGYAPLGGLVSGTYILRAEFSDVTVGSKMFDVPPPGGVVELPCKVCKLEVVPVDMWGNVMVGAKVTVRYNPTRYIFKTAEGVLKTPEKPVTFLIPEGSTCDISVSGGLYSGSTSLVLDRSMTVEVKSSITISTILFLTLTALLWFVMVYGWRRKMRVYSVETLKVKSMISKLDELHREGRVEDAIYKRLREEYMNRLNKLLESRA